MSVACAVLRFSDKGYSYTFKSATAIERIFADACYTVGNCHARKSATASERIFADACYNVGNRYARKSATSIERIFADAFNTSVRRNDAILTS